MSRSLYVSIRSPCSVGLVHDDDAPSPPDGTPVVVWQLGWTSLPELLIDIANRYLIGLLFPLTPGHEQDVDDFVRRCDPRCVSVRRPPPVESGGLWPAQARVIEVRWGRAELEATQVASLTEVEWLGRSEDHDRSAVYNARFASLIMGLRIVLIDDVLRYAELSLPPLKL